MPAPINSTHMLRDLFHFFFAESDEIKQENALIIIFWTTDFEKKKKKKKKNTCKGWFIILLLAFAKLQMQNLAIIIKDKVIYSYFVFLVQDDEVLMAWQQPGENPILGT